MSVIVGLTGQTTRLTVYTTAAVDCQPAAVIDADRPQQKQPRSATQTSRSARSHTEKTGRCAGQT